LVAHAPHDADLRVLFHSKNTLGLKVPCLLFEPVTTKDGAVGIEWRGACEFKAEDLLKNADGATDRLEEAKEYLLDLLAKGAVQQQQVKVKAKAWRTVERAKEVLGVKSTRKGWGPGSNCYWALPKQGEPDGDGDVRDAAALRALPAEEQDAWRKFWVDVESLRRKAVTP
jgi:hypothetical protein